MWEETLVFSIQMPQIALVRFDVWDHNPIGREFIGQRTIALTSMMPGKSKNCQTFMWRFFVFLNLSNVFAGPFLSGKAYLITHGYSAWPELSSFGLLSLCLYQVFLVTPVSCHGPKTCKLD